MDHNIDQHSETEHSTHTVKRIGLTSTSKVALSFFVSVLVLVMTVSFVQQRQDIRQQAQEIVPSPACIGSCPTLTLTQPDTSTSPISSPTADLTLTISPTEDTGTPSATLTGTPATSPSTTLTEIPTGSPSPTINPCPTDAEVNSFWGGGRRGGGSGGGWGYGGGRGAGGGQGGGLSQFIGQLLALLLQLILQLLGGGGGTPGAGPTPTPGIITPTGSEATPSGELTATPTTDPCGSPTPSVTIDPNITVTETPIPTDTPEPTATGEPTATPTSGPDLVVTKIEVALNPATAATNICGQLGFLVTVKNQGTTATTSQFDVEANSKLGTISSNIPVGSTASIWILSEPEETNGFVATATVDANDQIVEINETNNIFNQSVLVPTKAAQCITPTPTVQ